MTTLDRIPIMSIPVELYRPSQLLLFLGLLPVGGDGGGGGKGKPNA